MDGRTVFIRENKNIKSTESYKGREIYRQRPEGIRQIEEVKMNK